MLRQFSQASRLVNANIWLVVLAGVLVTTRSPLLGWPAVLISIVAVFLLQLIIYAKIADTVSDRSPSRAIDQIRSHWANFLIVAIVLALPIFFAKIVVSKLTTSASLSVYLPFAINAAVAVFTLYVLPIVFARNLGILSIAAGILFLLSHPRETIAPALLLLISLAIHLALTIIIVQQGLGIISATTAAAIYNLVGTYIEFIVFAMATTIVLGMASQRPRIE
jgi:hypothetical protein